MTKPQLARRQLVALVAGTALAATVPLRAEETTIAPEARDTITRMGKTLASGGFTFNADTIRQYEQNNLPLHIVHHAVVTVRRPDRLRIDIDGDDGRAQMGYDGTALTIYNVAAKRYGTLPVTGSIETMLRTASETIGMDFPLADLLADKPGQSFLDGVISGIKVGETQIGTQTCDHFFFVQPPGIELELWAEANDRALPRRIAITYRSIPGEPQFLAEMLDWQLGLNVSDDTFAIKPPADATKFEGTKQ